MGPYATGSLNSSSEFTSAFDVALATEVLTLAHAMPNHGIPVVNEKDLTLVEYPDPFIARILANATRDNVSSSVETVAHIAHSVLTIN